MHSTLEHRQSFRHKHHVKLAARVFLAAKNLRLPKLCKESFHAPKAYSLIRVVEQFGNGTGPSRNVPMECDRFF